MINALFLATSNSGVTYWRMHVWTEAARKTGAFGAHLMAWEKDRRDIADWQTQIGNPMHHARLTGELDAWVRKADVVVVQSIHTREALLLLYAIKDGYPHIPLVCEIDDDIFDIAGYNPAASTYAPGSSVRSVAKDQITCSDAVITTTPHLRDVYSEFCNHVYIIPNSIDFDHWGKVQNSKRGGIRIGWAGGASHNEDLELMVPVIPKVLESNKDARFVFVTAENGIPSFLTGIGRVDIVGKWKPILKYPQHLASQDFDIGIAPLRDNKFNRGKSNLRWLEFGALGIATVASRVGHFAQTIKDGEDGYLASDTNEFSEKLITLINDRAKRNAMGAMAQDRIRRDFNVEKNVFLYGEFLHEVKERGPVATAPNDLNGLGDVDYSMVFAGEA